MTTLEQNKQAYNNLEKFAYAHGLELEATHGGRPEDRDCKVGFKQTSQCRIVEIKDDGILRGTDAFGMFYPQARIGLVKAVSGQVLVINAMSDNRKEIRVPDLFAERPEPADEMPEGVTPAVEVFRCNGCGTSDWGRVYPKLLLAFCDRCVKLFKDARQEIQPEPVAPSLKQRFGDWIDARTAQGVETYGGPLTTDNGRDAERDMLEELLDFCQYQEQSRLELLADNAQLRQRIGVARERLGLPELENYSA